MTREYKIMEMTPEEMLVDFDEDEEWWAAYLKWAERCNEAAEEQYREEQRAERGER